MNDPLILFIFVIVSLGIGIQQTLYHCADAQRDGNRIWWKKALFRARQRAEYKDFCINIENDYNTQIQVLREGE